MRLVYFGTGSFAIPALERTAEHVVLVVTQPPRPTGRGMKVQFNSVHTRALELGIPVATPERARAAEFVEQIEALKPDALLVASYGQILSERLLNAAVRGGINLHGSILPDGRGAAPIQRSVMRGDHETGITLMQMDRGMDTGNIIEISRLPIGENETYGELLERMAHRAAGLAEHWMPRIIAGDYPRTPQPTEGVTIAPKIDPAETRLDPHHETALQLHNRARGLTPEYRPFLETTAGRLRVLRTLVTDADGDPGTITSVKPLTIAATEGGLVLELVQPEGKRAMSGSDFANGARLRPGNCLIDLAT